MRCNKTDSVVIKICTCLVLEHSSSRKMVKSKETRNQILSIMTVSLNEFSLGVAVGWLAPTSIILQDPKNGFNATLEERSWLAGIEYIGVIPGAIFTAFALDIIGRKILLISVAFIFFLMWVVNAMTNSMLVLCLVRFVFGFFFGINDSTNPTYLAENCSPKIRGAFGGASSTLHYTGLLTEYAIAAYFPYTVTSIINASLTFLAFLSVLWIKEPVQFLLMKGKVVQAEKNFVWLQGGDPDNVEINHELERIKQNVQSENQKKASLKSILTSPANYKSLSIVTIFYMMVGSTGYFPVMSYASTVFSPSDTLTPNEFTILFGIVQLLVIIPTTFFVDRFNRRSVVLFSFSLISLCHATTVLLYYIQNHVSEISYFPWLIFGSITLYSAVFAVVFPVVFVIRGELFPLSVKATGGCISVIFWSLSNFLTSKIFLQVAENFGIEVNFSIYLVFSILTIVFVYFFLPETKNKTLLEIQEMLEKKG